VGGVILWIFFFYIWLGLFGWWMSFGVDRAFVLSEKG
jgi:hypothetical protein